MTDGVGNPNAHYATEGMGGEVYLSEERQQEVGQRVGQMTASKQRELARAMIMFLIESRNPYRVPSVN